MPNTPEKAWEILRDLGFANQRLNGLLAQVAFYASMDTVVNNRIFIFEFDALGATIRDITIHMYLPNHGTATFTPSWEETRPNDLINFSVEVIPAMAAIVTPAASNYYRYHLGELAQGLQGRVGLLQSNNVPAVTVDCYAVMLMEV